MPIQVSKPKMGLVLTDKPKNRVSFNKAISNFTYLENKTIKAGQPLPWGLNWLITYPTQLDFIAPRT